MAGKIFVNYRRGEDEAFAGRLFDSLREVFKPEQLFMDVDSISPGLDFVRVLEEQVAQCDLVLAVIGKGWLEAHDAIGRRLDNPEDFVRIEIASALSQEKRVIPVLVGEARMPRADELPEAIRPLARRNAVRITHERFRTDAQALIKALQNALKEVEALRRRQKVQLISFRYGRGHRLHCWLHFWLVVRCLARLPCGSSMRHRQSLYRAGHHPDRLCQFRQTLMRHHPAPERQLLYRVHQILMRHRPEPQLEGLRQFRQFPRYPRTRNARLSQRTLSRNAVIAQR